MVRHIDACLGAMLVLACAAVATLAAAGKVDGTFVVGGSDAKLKYVRVIHTKLDEKGKMGYAVLLTAREPSGDVRRWQIADPKERGSFIYLQLEQNGAVWSADLGHALAKSGRFGVVTEVKSSGFRVQGDQLFVTIRTDGEQTFTQDKYNLNLAVQGTIEPGT